MDSTPQPTRRWQSIFAVLTGLAAIVVLSIGTDVLLGKIGVTPPPNEPMGDKLLAIALCYRTIYAVVGCYIAARLAPARPLKHALILGFIGLIVTALGVAATWGRPPTLGHEWYPIALVILSLPPAWVRGKVRELELADPTEHGPE